MRRFVLLALAALWAGLAAADDSSATLHALREGTVTSTVDGITREAPVTLPYHWDRVHKGRPGEARFTLPFRLAATPAEPWGLFIPRVGSTVEVALNGSVMATYGDLARPNTVDYAKAPVYLPIPAHLLLPGDNVVQIRIHADSGRRAGLSVPTLGPSGPVRGELFASAYAWRFTGSVLLSAFSIVVGTISLGLWLTQAAAGETGRPHRESLYLWAALAEFCWALRVADGAIREPPLPWVAWGVLMTACYSGWAGSCLMFCQHLAGWQDRPGMRWLPPTVAVVFTVPVFACYVALARGEPIWLTGWLALEIVAVTAYVLFFLGATIRRPTAARMLVASALVLTLAVAVRDWFVIRMSDAYGDTTWVRYTSLFFGMALLGVVLMRFREATAQSRELLRTLAVRVADRERELASAYGQLEMVAREQARTQERERILRDMHDGVGSHISAAIRQMQSGQANVIEVLRTLRDSMDQLKLSIDSIQLPPGDVQALLAGLRYRLEPRFASSGLALEWAVDELPLLPRLDAPLMRQLQFLLFEALSNVLQHAQARVLRIEAAMAGTAVRIGVIDDGVGFDAARLPRALALRAEAIGATIEVQSRPGRTVVQVDLA
ncbi:sensor histidine kinase [Variovorax sp. ZT4R33]|uniref:sensor histidine kinase n=1 Tax=Variovorax sp. ZT4R33 TaxID=3443743 RepID=UPI003F48E5A0